MIKHIAALVDDLGLKLSKQLGRKVTVNVQRDARTRCTHFYVDCPACGARATRGTTMPDTIVEDYAVDALAQILARGAAGEHNCTPTVKP